MSLKSLLKSVLFGVPIGITFLDTIGYVARVEGISMQPALNPESRNTDYVFLSRWSVRNYTVKRGDIISLVSPKDPNQKIIKRVVGLEGDVVSTLGYKNQYVKVPEGHCWVEGDHTGHTLDSNTFGPVSLGLINARAIYIVWPPERWQSLEAKLPESRKPVSLPI
ncbi:mitochondrial inner membrane protease subunit 2 [Aricia agestis]|uniref:mitochondrial inner membrane protease subunit 2 n=1 Tax=Aricia agestis TaxID=91739 RepID=UPI001C208264|nr:mitochondrial inner membrane protease subunit 2 [Aricia agestis]